MEYFEEKIYHATVIAYSFTKYSLKRGLKELEERGEKAVTEELYQIHMRDTFFSKSAKHLTKEQKRDALKYLMFLKVKRYVILKV